LVVSIDGVSSLIEFLPLSQIKLFSISKRLLKMNQRKKPITQIKQTNKQTNKTKQNKTKQNKTKQNKTKQNKTKQNKTKQNKTKPKNIKE
jgi:hypothetical protein